MDSSPPLPLSSPSEFRRGAQAALPSALGVIAAGLVWGALARQAGMGAFEAGLMSGLVFAGAAQFVALDLWADRALPVLQIAFATLIVNLRFLLMGAAVRDLFDGCTRTARGLKAFLISDENWALASAEMARGRGSAGYLLGAGAITYAAWLGASLAGAVLGKTLGDPARWGLDFALTATFLALLAGLWKGRTSLLPWGVAAGAALLAQALLPGKWYIVVGGLVGSASGAWTAKPRTATP